MRLRHNALQADNILMVELGHNTRFRQKIAPILLRRSALERFNRHSQPHATLRALQLSLTHITKLAAANHRLNFDVQRRDLLRKLLDRNRWVFVIMRVDVIRVLARLLQDLARRTRS